MREKLILARKANGLTQSKLSKYLDISTRHYQNIEYGIRKGSFEVWDKLEDLFGISQRQLRENTKRPDTIRQKEHNKRIAQKAEKSKKKGE